MAYSHHERLSGVDAMFLRIEEPNVPMHVGAVAIFEAGPLGRPSGGLDFAHIPASAESALPHSPRFRQKLASVPLLKYELAIGREIAQLRDLAASASASQAAAEG
jgi:hypothetical protein